MALDAQGAAGQALEEVDQKGLASVAELARQIRDQEQTIEALEEVLKNSKRSLRNLTDEELPAILAEIGLTSFKLEDGSTVAVKQTYGASILVKNRIQAYEWLRENSYDDIIKNKIEISFGRGEDDQASDFSQLAEGAGFNPEQKTEIHPQTLRAFVKERVEAGDEFPMSLFGAWIGQRAVIKKGKK
jgi:hypothetical protein|tara:strand:+ start:1981 stop:2541 length:561 start_codon:yes stop_codon:yes gene_type:complete